MKREPRSISVEWSQAKMTLFILITVRMILLSGLKILQFKFITVTYYKV